MATFYIDYENVHNGGTTGIDQLTNREYVFMFYSQNANTMNMDAVKHFLDSRCGIEFVEADTGTANALDFQLVTFLYTGLNQDDYHYIISKDHGFDAAVKMGNRIGINNVKRFTTIVEAYRHYEKYKKEMQEENLSEERQIQSEVQKCNETAMDNKVIENEGGEMKDGSKINEEKYRKIMQERIKRIVQKGVNITLPREELDISIDGICNSDNKMKLYHFLRKNLGDSRGRSVYTALSEEFIQIKLDMSM